MDATDDTDGKAPAVRRASIQGQSNPSVSSVKSVIKAREYPADKQPQTKYSMISNPQPPPPRVRPLKNAAKTGASPDFAALMERRSTGK